MDTSPAANVEWAEATLRQLDPDDLPSTPQGRHRLALVAGASTALGEIMVSNPGRIAGLLDSKTVPPVTRDTVCAALQGTAPGQSDLALQHRIELFAIATRDLEGKISTEEAAGELSELADGILSTALSVVTAGVAEAQLGVLAMGKLGGQELNYVSDLDVVFVHRGDAAVAGEMAQAFLQLTGGMGGAYTMDPNLRPEGRNGPLTRTVEAYVGYYADWSEPWEIQALLKMRPVAGPQDLLEELIAGVAPLLWPESRGANAVIEIQTMKKRVEKSRPVRRDGDRELKLAPGGLRDIEFAVQLLQLVHGPADPLIRQRGTLPALAALADGGYVDEGDAYLFADAYRFLRTVEHRLQLRRLRRTHTLPTAAADVQRLAKVMGFRDLPVKSAADAFEHELGRVRTGVRRLHQQLFYRPLLSTIASWDSDTRVGSPGRLDLDGVERRLQALAFRSPGAANRNIAALVNGSGRTAKQLRVVLPAMLEVLAETPAPDQGLAALRTTIEGLRTNPRLLRTIRDNPSAARLLAQILGGSPRLADWIVRQPEVLRFCDDPQSLSRPRTRQKLLDGAQGIVRRSGGSVSADSLRRYKRREALRIAIRSILGEAEVVRVGQELSWLCEAMLQAALEGTLATAGVEDLRMSVIAVGRFGAQGLHFSSDLDVIFVHDGDAADAEAVAAAFVAMLKDITPEGTAFEIDVGLRPEGRQGPLTRSLDSHAAYYDRWAAPWELFAMTQARPVAGDPDLGQAFGDMIGERVYAGSPDAERLRAVRKMKARIELERAGGRRSALERAPRAGRRERPQAGANDDLKLGPGGQSDVEWLVQLLRMIHGAAVPELRRAGTVSSLPTLVDAEILTEQEATWLRDGMTFLSDIRNGLYLMGERHTTALPASPDERARLAKILEHDSATELVDAIDRARRRIRRVFDRHFFDV